MARALYSATTGAAVALSAATVKTVLSVIAPATFGVDLRSFTISSDGATSTATPIFWELGACTFGAAGTGTSGTVRQDSGRAITAGFTTLYAYSAEPTTITAIEADYIPAFNGLLVRDFGFNEGYDNDVSTGFVLRLTAPATVNVRATLRFGRC